MASESEKRAAAKATAKKESRKLSVFPENDVEAHAEYA